MRCCWYNMSVYRGGRVGEGVEGVCVCVFVGFLPQPSVIADWKCTYWVVLVMYSQPTHRLDVVLLLFPYFFFLFHFSPHPFFCSSFFFSIISPQWKTRSKKKLETNLTIHSYKHIYMLNAHITTLSLFTYSMLLLLPIKHCV